MSGHSAQERFAVTMEGRRRWSRVERLAIVAEIGAGPVSAVARKHNVASSLLFRWRREFGGEASATSKPVEPSFVRVALPAPASHGSVSTAPSVVGDGSIEIVLAGGRRVIVGKDVDVTALKRVIEALESR
jgi:transposase